MNERIVLPQGMRSPPPAGPQGAHEALTDAIGFHDRELALLGRLRSQSPAVVKLVALHEESRGAALALLAKVYDAAAPGMLDALTKTKALLATHVGAMLPPPREETP